MTAWTTCDCSVREGKARAGGWGPTYKKVSAPLVLTRKEQVRTRWI